MADSGEGPVAVMAPVAALDCEDDEDDDFMDETLCERLLGLTEVLPEPVQRGGAVALSLALRTISGGYQLARTCSWVFFSSACILLAPAMFEMERCQVDEMHKQQQRQILLGPNAAVSGSTMSPSALR